LRIKKISRLFLFFFIFFVQNLYPLSFDLAKKIDIANTSYLEGSFEQAFELYRNFLETVKDEELNLESDRKAFDEAEEAFQELEVFLKVRSIFPLFQKAKELEKEKNYLLARDSYFEIREFLNQNQINQTRFFDEITNGELENYLLEKKKEEIKNRSYTLLEEVKADKKRKKSIVFLEFEKDSKVNYDIELLIKNTFNNILEVRNSFIYKESYFHGKIEERKDLVKKKKVDFYISGKYQKISNDLVLLTFYVFDAFTDKRLVNVRVKALLDFEFFDTVEQILFQIERALKDYSRLEDFAELQFSKEGKNKLVKGKNKNLKDRTGELLTYTQNKIVENENLYLASLLKKAEEDSYLSSYDGLGSEIFSFNEKKPLQLFSYDAYFQKQKENIKDALIKESPLYQNMLHMRLSKEAQLYKEYFVIYQEARENLSERYKTYPGLKPLISEIDEKIDLDQKEVEETVLMIGKRIEEREGITLSFNLFPSSLVHKNTESSLVKNDRSIQLSYTFEKRFYKDIWLSASVGLGLRNYSTDRYQFQGIFLTTDFFRVKYYYDDMFSVFIGSRFVTPTVGDITDKNQTYLTSNGGVTKTPSFFWTFGLGYLYHYDPEMDFEFNLVYGLPIAREKLKIDFSDTQKQYKDFFEFSFTAFLNDFVYNIDYKPSLFTGLWVSFLISPSVEVKLKLPEENNNDSINAETLSLGLGLAYYFYDNIAVTSDFYLFSYYFTKDGFFGTGKGFFNDIALEVSVLPIFDSFSFFLRTGFGYFVFYDKGLKHSYDNAGTGVTDTLPLKSQYLCFYPLSMGFRWAMTPNINIKIMGIPPLLDNNTRINPLIVFKFEFKL